jgi:hypothetical protein
VDDRVLVILTHGKFKTGTDIPRLGHVVLLDSISNIAEFEQTIGRIMRVYGRTGQRKDYTKMYVYSPGVTIKEVVARLAHENTRLPTDESRTELEFLSCFPISEYDGLTIKPLDSAQLFEEFRDRLRLHSAIVNFKLPSEIRSLVEGDQSILDSLALLAKRANRGNTKVGVTEENNSQVFADDGDQSDDNQNKSKNSVSQQRTIDQIINGLEEIWINVPPFAMIGESDRVIDVLTCEPLIDMFGEDKIYSVVSVLQTYPEFAKRLQNRLDIFLTAFKDLPPEDCYDIVFKNCERKMKQGLVFTPFDVANMHIDNIPMDEYNNKYGY